MNRQFLTLATAILVLMTAFVSCKKDRGGSGSSGGDDTDSPFSGAWIMDGSGGNVTMEIGETTWVVKHEKTIYCSGEYIYKGSAAVLEITNSGESSADVGDVGAAKISDDTITVSGFSDGILNGTFTKKGESEELKGIKFKEDEITLIEEAKHILELVAIPSGADLPQCNFVSDDSDIATVNATTGEVTAVAKGLAVITATTPDGAFTANCFVTVVADDGGDPDNPFIGTWIWEYDDAMIFEIKANTWAIEYYDYPFCSGTYACQGNMATLTVTEVDLDYTGLEKGDKGTAQVSGNKMTVTFYGESLSFTKKDGDDPGNDLYREPYLNFGTYKDAVKNYENRVLYDDGYGYLYYWGENSDVRAVLYHFDYDNDDKMYWNVVCLNNTNNIEQRALDFLKKKYEYSGEIYGEHYFISSDGTIGVILYHTYDEWFVQYDGLSNKSAFPMKKVFQSGYIEKPQVKKIFLKK